MDVSIDTIIYIALGAIFLVANLIRKKNPESSPKQLFDEILNEEKDTNNYNYEDINRKTIKRDDFQEQRAATRYKAPDDLIQKNKSDIHSVPGKRTEYAENKEMRRGKSLRNLNRKELRKAIIYSEILKRKTL